MTAILQELKSCSESAFRRRFLLEGLPDGMRTLDRHLQIFENYVEETGLRFRKIRVPETSERLFLLEKTKQMGEIGGFIQLSEPEYGRFKTFWGREIRLNRYRHELVAPNAYVDIFLGALSGLCIQTFDFPEAEKAREFSPDFPYLTDITDDRIFDGGSLVDLDFDKVRRHIEQKKAAT